jgi:hypothetical protein
MNYKNIFTLTAGRTGTLWLAKLLEENLEVHSVHEPLGIEDFGVSMPEIKHMRTFNDLGNTPLIKEFFKKKFEKDTNFKAYAETNHTLGKCGLIENLTQSSICKDTIILVLRRDLLQQCCSFINRGDFTNITLEWQWYLTPSYRNIIIPFREFKGYGSYGRAAWYTQEMEARQLYYLLLYGDKLNFLEIELSTVTTPIGAKDLLTRLSGDRNLTKDSLSIPPAVNKNFVATTESQIKEVAEIFSEVGIITSDCVKEYIKQGRKLDSPI